MVLSLQTVNRVEEIVARTQVEGRAPALVVAVVRDGSVAHLVAAGKTPKPDRNVQFRIGSISKTMTAAVLLGLRDEDQVRLDDQIGAYVPKLPPAVAALRLRELLGMASGLQREPDGDWWERSPGRSADELLDALHDGKVATAPYQRFHYSNLGYGLLGAAITTVTGQTWYEAVAQRILQPLGMQRTSYQPQEPYARGYVIHPWDGTAREEPTPDTDAMAPAGQLWSTAADLSRWAAVLAGAPPRDWLLRPATVAEMATPVILADPDSWTSGYGLGLQLFRRGERVFAGHTGSMPGYLAVLLAHRPSRTAVVAFTNTYSLVGQGIGGLGMALLEAVLDGEPAPAPAPWRPASPPPPEVAALCGPWWWMGREYLMTWQATDRQLVLVPPRAGVPPWAFRQEGPDLWRGVSGEEAGELLRVLRDENGAVVGLDIATFVYRRFP